MLYVCATPIGNLEDVSLRVLETLRRADVVLCEDTRHSAGLFRRHGITPGSLLSFHEHNEEMRVQPVLELLRAGKDVALVTDAGMPGLSDPGFTLVRACAEAGVEVTVLPGASAVTTALVASGLPTDRFTFVGFLPRGRAKAAAALDEIGAAGGTIVAFESPHRLRSTLKAVAERWPSRPVAVCRELTKLHEEVLRGTAAEVLESLDERVRGEVVVVVGSAQPGQPGPGVSGEARGSAAGGPAGADAGDVLLVLDALLARGLRTKEASALLCRLTGMDARTAYAAAQEAKQRSAPVSAQVARRGAGPADPLVE